MPSSFNYSALMHHAYLVGISDGGEAVGNGNGGPGGCKPVKSFLDDFLRFCVKG